MGGNEPSVRARDLVAQDLGSEGLQAAQARATRLYAEIEARRAKTSR
jgi:hypothetical protein